MKKKNILFKCVICGNKMPSLASLKAHIKRQHPKKSLETYKHKNIKHKKALSTENVSFICTICNDKFKRKNSLERHLRMVHNEYFENNDFKGEKRKNKDDPSTYVKRKKHNKKQQIEYKDYF